MVFWNRVGFGIFENAINELLLCIMRLRPTTPDELPSPSGCRGEADCSSSAALLIAPAARTTRSAVYSSRAPSRVTTTRSTAPPDGVVSNRVTRAPVSRATFGYRSAGSTHTVCASALPLTRQGNPSQVAQRTQADRCGRASSMRMPLGSSNGCIPAAARSARSWAIRGSWLIGG